MLKLISEEISSASPKLWLGDRARRADGRLFEIVGVVYAVNKYVIRWIEGPHPGKEERVSFEVLEDSCYLDLNGVEIMLRLLDE